MSDQKKKRPFGIVKKEKHRNFKRLAEKRVQNVLKYLQLIENLSNRHNYYYEANEVNKIFTVIEDEIKRVKPLFKKPKIKKEEFSLD